MIHYVYDGTFEGLLTVVAGVIHNPEKVYAISNLDIAQPDLLTEIKFVETDRDVADAFFKLLSKEFSKLILLEIGYCFLSEEPGIEKVILDYIRMLLTAGKSSARKYTDNAVVKIRRTCDKVTHEIHRLHGFIRFRRLKNGIYYAPIEPDRNVLQFLAPHFSARFADQHWLIHDCKRKTGIYYNTQRCRFIPLLEEFTPALNQNDRLITTGLVPAVFEQNEALYQHIWDEYFQNIAIRERYNKKLQKQRMPVRYWKCLVEKVKL